MKTSVPFAISELKGENWTAAHTILSKEMTEDILEQTGSVLSQIIVTRLLEYVFCHLLGQDGVRRSPIASFQLGDGKGNRRLHDKLKALHSFRVAISYFFLAATSGVKLADCDIRTVLVDPPRSGLDQPNKGDMVEGSGIATC
eukprot:scaffold696_cov163-Ochromonas_danica.AAC.9